MVRLIRFSLLCLAAVGVTAQIGPVGGLPVGPYRSMVQSASGDVICALHADSITGMACGNQVVDGTTETAFTNGVSIPAGTISSGSFNVFTQFLIHTSSGTTPTLTYRMRLGGIGGTVIYQATSAPTAGTTDFVATFGCEVTALAASSATTPVVATCNTTSTGAVLRNALLSNTTQSVATDTTTTKTLVWTITYSAATAGNAIGLYSMFNGIR